MFCHMKSDSGSIKINASAEQLKKKFKIAQMAL